LNRERQIIEEFATDDTWTENICTLRRLFQNYTKNSLVSVLPVLLPGLSSTCPTPRSQNNLSYSLVSVLPVLLPGISTTCPTPWSQYNLSYSLVSVLLVYSLSDTPGPTILTILHSLVLLYSLFYSPWSYYTPYSSLPGPTILLILLPFLIR